MTARPTFGNGSMTLVPSEDFVARYTMERGLQRLKETKVGIQDCLWWTVGFTVMIRLCLTYTLYIQHVTCNGNAMVLFSLSLLDGWAMLGQS